LFAVEHVRGLEATGAPEDERVRLLQRVQPGLSGLIDGSLSSLAPIFAVVMSTHRPGYAFVAGLATAIGAAISMAFSEGLSDTGTVTERGNAWKRGCVVGGGTLLGGILHTVPFLIPYYLPALTVALAVVVVELLALAATPSLLRRLLCGIARHRHARRRAHFRGQHRLGRVPGHVGRWVVPADPRRTLHPVL
jgi:VIT1/CCC1 family predicted Fe2+/Mn2+ transporter